MKPITDDHDVNWGGGRIFAKASGDFVGGGGVGSHTHSAMGGMASTGGYTVTRPTNTEKLYNAIKAVYLRRQTKFDNETQSEIVFDVIKDRHGKHGLKDLEEAIEVCAEMLSMFKFQDGNYMFHETLTMRLKEVMKEVLLGDDVIPTQKAIQEYIEGGERDGNNIC